MKKLKFLSIVLVLLLALTAMPTVSMAADSQSEIFSIIGLNLAIEEGQSITRYDLAKMAISLGGLTVYETGEAVYADIPEKHWAFAEINTVTTYGYMSGLADGTFMPDSEASIGDAAQVLMNLLGYGSFGKQADWNTSDYLMKAKNIGLLTGVASSTGKLDVESLEKMIVNMLAENIVTIGSIGNEGANFVVDNEVTYLQSRYGYVFKEGVMQAAGKSAITGSSTVPSGKVKIAGVTYDANGADYSKYLGYEVRVILDKNEENANVLYMEQFRSTEESEITIPANKIDSFSSYTFTYRDEDEKIEQAKITGTSQIFLNGQKVMFDERLMQPLSGSVRLLDTNGDSVYDMVYVTYELFYEVSGAFEDEYIADAITGKTLNIKKIEFSVFENGITSSIDAIQNEAVVAVMPGAITFEPGNVPVADNTNMTRSYIETGIRKISGLVTAKGANSCTIGGEEYSYSKYYTMLAANGYANLPALNKDAVMYINSADEIVYAKLDAQAIAANQKYKYAYLIRAAEARGGEKLVVRMFTQDAQIISTETPDKFKFNGRNADVDDVTSNATLFPGGTFQSQLIAYEMDEETGLITSIITPTDYTAVTDYEGYDLVNFSLEYKNSSALYRNSFLHLYTVNEDSILFDIPSDLSMDEKYAVKTGSSIFTYNTSYNIALYDADDAYNVKASVIDRTTSGGSALDARRDISINHFQRGIVTFVVEDKNIVLNAEGEEVYELTGKSHNAGVIEELRLTATDNELPDTDKSSFGHIYSEYEGVKWYQLSAGDVIHFRLDSNGYVERFRVVFRPGDMRDGLGNIKYKTSGAPTSSTFVVAGAVERVLADGTIMFRTAANANSTTLKKASSNPMIYIFENGKARKGTAAELRPDEAALFVSESGILYEMIVYRD